MEQNFIDEFQSLFEENEISYFYHMTESGNGDSICEDGLFLAQNDILTTAIPITSDMLKDSKKFLQEENDHFATNRSEMVIIGCPSDCLDELIISSSENGDEYIDVNLQYMIPLDYILGYIDMKTQEITYNEYYGYSAIK